MAGLHPAIMVATIVAIIVANTAIIRRSYGDHAGTETGQREARKASKATPIRNPPITIHITNLVSAIPPPLLLFYSLSQIFS